MAVSTKKLRPLLLTLLLLLTTAVAAPTIDCDCDNPKAPKPSHPPKTKPPTKGPKPGPKGPTYQTPAPKGHLPRPPVVGPPKGHVPRPPVVGPPKGHVPRPPVYGPPKGPITRQPVTAPPVVVGPPVTYPTPPVTAPPVTYPAPPVTAPPVSYPAPPVTAPPVTYPAPPVTNPPVTYPSPPVNTPCPPPPPATPAAHTCPVDSLKIGACVDLLGGLVHVGLGDPVVNKCCPLLEGLVVPVHHHPAEAPQHQPRPAPRPPAPPHLRQDPSPRLHLLHLVELSSVSHWARASGDGWMDRHERMSNASPIANT